MVLGTQKPIEILLRITADRIFQGESTFTLRRYQEILHQLNNSFVGEGGRKHKKVGIKCLDQSKGYILLQNVNASLRIEKYNVAMKSYLSRQMPGGRSLTG